MFNIVDPRLDINQSDILKNNVITIIIIQLEYISSVCICRQLRRHSSIVYVLCVPSHYNNYYVIWLQISASLGLRFDYSHSGLVQSIHLRLASKTWQRKNGAGEKQQENNTWDSGVFHSFILVTVYTFLV
jgi:hypothetical protein